MGLIYMRTSPSGGRYIGQTIYTEEERWKNHCKEAFNPNDDCYNTILNIAIRKYGKDNFHVQILEDNIQTRQQLNEREIYWIEYYKTYYKDGHHGYNMTRGGDSGTIEKGTTGIPILQYDIKGNFIKEWISAQVASEYFKNHVNNLYLVLNHGRVASYCGYLWKKKNDPITVEELIDNYKKKKAYRGSSRVGVYCVQTNKSYYCLKQASEELSVTTKMISKYAKLGIPEPRTGLEFKLLED